MKKSLGISFIASLLILSSAVTASAVKFEFDVDASNSRFSKEYEPYYPHITADTSTVEEIYERISSDTIVLTPIQKQTRMAMIEMYKNAGFDISLPYMTGNENYGTSRSIEDLPASWSTKTPKPLNGRYEQCFSIDACWNNKIPLDFPKVEIPKEVFSFSNFMIATVGSKMQPGGNGTGIPVIIGKKDDPKKLLLDKEGMAKIRKLYEFRCPDNVADYLNTNTNSDAHAVFIDDEHKVGIQTWRTSASGSWTSPGLATMQNVPGYDIRSACISNVFRLDGIGADGGRAGVYATQVVTHGFTIKDWEINEPDAVINHAVSGAFNPLCTGWVYPALRSDAGAKNVNPGNVGSIIQGALLRLDPEFDLEAVYSAGKLSLPAYKILKAMQDYGMYNLDKGGNSANIGCIMYTSTGPQDWLNASDSRYNVPYKKGAQGCTDVQEEIMAFFANDEFFGFDKEPKLFVTIPNVKYAKLDVNGDGNTDRADESIVKENVDKELTDSNKACDINQDGNITGRDAEIFYNYFNNLGQHTIVYYNVSHENNDTEHGYIVAAADFAGRSKENTNQYKEGLTVSFGAIPYPGYEFECWTGDFEGVTDRTLLLKMDKDYTFGARYKKKDNVYKVKVTVEGPGKIQYTTATMSEYKDCPAEAEYGENDMIALKRIKDSPDVKFLGWSGDIEGYGESTYITVNKDMEIKAVFSNEGFNEEYNKEDWKSINGKFSVTFVPETSRINFAWSNFQDSTAIYNSKSYIDDGYTYSLTINNGTPYGDALGGNIFFNYKDPKNYYYVRVGGGGSMTLGKVYNGIKSTLRTFEKERVSGGVAFKNWPMDIKITRTKDQRITVEGFKDGKKIVYFDKVKDTAFRGGMIGVGSANHGTVFFKDIVLMPIEDNTETEE